MKSFACFATLLAALLCRTAGAAVGLTQLPADADHGPFTVYYPSSGTAQALQRGPFTLNLAADGAPAQGNRRLVVISHGSGGSPWVHATLATALVDAGYVVVMPEHRRDNYRDPSTPGPESWKIRPAEVSHAIDAVAADRRFAPLLSLDQVGVYGMSAGGHTALSLAGGVWSPAGFKAHCDAHLVEDFQSCVGLATRLTGGWLDGLKKWLALAIIDHRFDDATPQAHTDPRVAAIVAAVPAAADFEMSSFAHPRVPLGLVTAGRDAWLTPRFHSDRVLAACAAACELVAHLPDGGHGSMLSPLPPGLTGLVGDLLNDPPGFDRSQLPAVDLKIVAFFDRHLLRHDAGSAATPAQP